MTTICARGRSLGFAALVTLLTATAPAWAQVQILDQVVAIVDDDVVMASELEDRLAGVRAALQSRGGEMPPEDVLQRETLDRLILESIQMQMAERAGVRISDQQVIGAMERIAGQSGMSLEAFSEAIAADGDSMMSLRENIYRELVIQRVQASNVNQRIQLSPQEVDNYLESEEGRLLSQPNYRILHALIPLASGASAADEQGARDALSKLRDRINAGEAFEEVIGEVAEQLRITGGDLGWRTLEDLPSVYQDIAQQLSVGETSEPFRSPAGYHMVKLVNQQGGTMIQAQTKVRHILIRPSAIRDEEATQALAEDIYRRLKEGADFIALAKQYSEDIGSAQEGGELGWTFRGQMVPEFESAMEETETGELAPPVRSQFGWHVLRVDDRREQDVTRDNLRNRAAELLHSRKFEEELDAWLRKIRDEAFVDIK